MSTVTTQTTDEPRRPALQADNGDSELAPTSSHGLFVIPRGRRDGFQATIRGHILDLADPSSGALAPTPDDLFIASIATDLAWSARRLLRARGLPDDVSVSAHWRTTDGVPSPADIDVTVTVPDRAEPVSEALAAAFASSLAARSGAEPAVHISWEGANR